MIIINKQQFKEIKKFPKCSETDSENREVVRKKIKEIQRLYPEKRWDRSKKLLDVLDHYLFFSMMNSGFSYFGRDTIAERYSVGLRTVDMAISILKEAGMIKVAYLPNKNSNGGKTPVIFLTFHRNYTFFDAILKFECDTKRKVKSGKTSGGSKDKPSDSDSNHSKTFSKQEKDNKKHLDINRLDLVYKSEELASDYDLEEEEKNLMKYIWFNIQETRLKSGFQKIKHMSSFVKKVFNTKFRQAFAEHRAHLEREFQKRAEAAAPRNVINTIPSFYNWLED